MKRTVTLSLRRLLPALLLLAVLVPAVFIGLSLLANRSERAARPDGLGEARRPARTGDTSGPVAKAIPAIPDRPTGSAVAGATYTLRATTNEMTWMLVTIDGGETRDVLLREGETWEWRAQEGFVLTIGNAGGVTLTLNGHPVPQLGEPGQVIRDLYLPAEYVPPAEFR